VRDRIKELRRVKASELVDHDKNWRRHPPAQRTILRELLKEVGFADAVIAREDKKGRLILIDGHLRRDLSKSAVIPVLVLDVTKEEADKLLATLDPIAAMADADNEAFRALRERIASESHALNVLLDELAAGGNARDIPADVLKLDGSSKVGAMEYRIVIECDDESQQRELLERFLNEGLRVTPLIS
jgi:ParB-like chromosome segregation protein Spo0J